MGVIYKLEDLLKNKPISTTHSPHIVPFTKIQEALYDHAPESYCITLMRRMMFRLQTPWLKGIALLFLQVNQSTSSQPNSPIHACNKRRYEYPIIRPLATTDNGNH